MDEIIPNIDEDEEEDEMEGNSATWEMGSYEKETKEDNERIELDHNCEESFLETGSHFKMTSLDTNFEIDTKNTIEIPVTAVAPRAFNDSPVSIRERASAKVVRDSGRLVTGSNFPVNNEGIGIAEFPAIYQGWSCSTEDSIVPQFNFQDKDETARGQVTLEYGRQGKRLEPDEAEGCVGEAKEDGLKEERGNRIKVYKAGEDAFNTREKWLIGEEIENPVAASDDCKPSGLFLLDRKIRSSINLTGLEANPSQPTRPVASYYYYEPTEGENRDM
ncbi:unnamed protein product [Protopolystoma xenopodis]|uniref:Uncharacterized protein n=1 Tax=Protopolystoma xenopodis TaxID=117903 RepID=A0A3S5AR19_9PLAT|nr:unnamed protein product [Protopolystoma xenopodis]